MKSSPRISAEAVDPNVYDIGVNSRVRTFGSPQAGALKPLDYDEVINSLCVGLRMKFRDRVNIIYLEPSERSEQ